MHIILICLILLFSPFLTAQETVYFHIDLTRPSTPISPFIYGTNQELSGKENWALFRLGGNRMTAYNWENNASNAGADWYHNSDGYLTSRYDIPAQDQNDPGRVLTAFHDRSLAYNARSIITIQMAGYAAQDKNGQVSVAETAPSSRWVDVRPRKESPFSPTPDTQDGFVYMDEMVHFLVDQYQTAADPGGIHGYCLDNEPALWHETHPRIHPEQATCEEVVEKSIAYASTVKREDPDAEVLGPCLYGFAAYTDFQGAADWNTVQNGKSYQWFIDYYLDQMKAAEADSGKRLLDVLDIHWYPEAKGDHRIVSLNADTEADHQARVQAPRTLWDPAYVEDSWIGQWGQSFLPLIPALKSAIDQYYPGTKIAFTEIYYGGPDHISGTLAMADVLGIFARYGIYMSCLWPFTTNADYISAAYQIYRNYDGLFSTFGDQYAVSTTSDSVLTSVYGSVSVETDAIHLVVINKSFTETVRGMFQVDQTQTLTSGRVWCVAGGSAAIQEIDPVTDISDNSFEYSMKPASVHHFVFPPADPTNIRDHDANRPDTFELKTWPNPFNHTCQIGYRLPVSSHAGLHIVAMDGRLVKAFRLLLGTGIVTWDGTDDQGRPVASGIYTVVVHTSGNTIHTKKVVVLK